MDMPNPHYTTPDGSIIHQSNQIRDLGVTMCENAEFSLQIDNAVKKAKQSIGWILRSFKSRETSLMLTLYKTMVLPLLEYCSQLWCPTTIGEIRKMESVQRTFTSRLDGMNDMNYWERLSHLKLYSLERRRERFMIIYVWKIIQGLVPNFNHDFAVKTTNSGRRGVLAIIPPISKSWTKVQTIKESSIAVHGPRLFNCIPQKLRSETYTPESFKRELDRFLHTVEDKPSLPQYHQTTPGNSLLHRLIPAHRGWRTSAT